MTFEHATPEQRFLWTLASLEFWTAYCSAGSVAAGVAGLGWAQLALLCLALLPCVLIGVVWTLFALSIRFSPWWPA